MAEADRRDFATIEATTSRWVTVSYSRRDAEGRLLGRSPLIAGRAETYLARGHTPDHAASEADRLLARPAEFASIPIGRSGLACWRAWYGSDLTAYDGLLAAPAFGLQVVHMFTRDPVVGELLFLTYAVFYGFTINHVLRYVLRPGEVTADKIHGAIAGYLLAGLLWMSLYLFLDQLHPGSF